jgi:small neutral amino acid transporter SnatA (MarC family)
MDLPEHFLESTSLLIVLLNPFLMSIYLLDLIESLEDRVFIAVLARGAAIATGVFWGFAAGGDAIFADFLQVRFASFLIFGGVLFLLIGLRFALQGTTTLVQLRGAPEHIAGSIAMPFMVGPGTVSASVLAGVRLPLGWALAAIAVAMVSIVCGLILLKVLHTRMKQRNAALLDRYVDVVGRACALLIGTIAIDMILTGLDMWWPFGRR